MTKTDNLQLCTWVESDPVSLEQMNENFVKLDTAGSSALAQAKAAAINTAGLLLHAHHKGQDISFAESVFVADFTQPEDVQAYENVLLSSGGAQIPASGYSGETFTDLHEASGASLNIAVAHGQKTILQFRPSSYGKLCGVTIAFSGLTQSTYTDELALYRGQTLLAKTSFTKSDTGTLTSVSYSFPETQLDPNVDYELRMKTDTDKGRVLDSITTIATPQVFTTGSVEPKTQTLPIGCKRVHLDIYCSGTAPVVSSSEDGGDWTRCALYRSRTAKSQTGAACTLKSYLIPVTEETEFSLRIALPAANCVIYALSAAIL